MKSFKISAILLALVLASGSVCAQPKPVAASSSTKATLADIDALKADLRRIEDGLAARVRTLENKPAGGDTRQLEAKVRDLEARIRALETRTSDILTRVERLERPAAPVRR